MTHPATPAVGIDLGTTFSVAAHLDERGVPVTLVNAEGDRLTPSVVLIDGPDVVVGKEAMKAMIAESEHVAECVKRDMGHRVFHKVLEGKQYAPEVLQAWILNKLRVDSSRQIGPFGQVVITVPAYFDEVRRKATQDAGYMAGLTHSATWSLSAIMAFMASLPTTTSGPSSSTTLGVKRSPSALTRVTGWPCSSKWAATENVVPRSMPTAGLAEWGMLAGQGQGPGVGGRVGRAVGYA